MNKLSTCTRGRRFCNRLIQGCAMLLLLLQLVSCFGGEEPREDHLQPDFSTVFPPLKQTIEEKIGDAVAKNNALTNFKYQFLTTAYVEEQPAVFLVGTFDNEGETKVASVSYIITEELYNWFRKFDITVTVQGETYVFGNDYYVVEDRKDDILAYLFSLAKGKAHGVREMTLEEQKDYVIQSNFEREHNLELAHMQYASHIDDFKIYFTCESYSILEATGDGQYVCLKVDYTAEEYILEDVIYQDENGEYIFYSDGSNFMMVGYNEVTMSREELLEILSTMGEYENNPIGRSEAIRRFPIRYKRIISEISINIDAKEYKEYMANNK